MKISLYNRIRSAACAAAVIIGNTYCNIPAVFAAAEQTVIPDTEAVQTSELKKVIVTLNGDTALECVAEPDELTSSAALSTSERAKKQQERIIHKLRRQYPELEPDFQYTTLLNAFSCSMPEALIPYAESLRGVESVTASAEVNAEPAAEEPFSLSDLPAYYDETNCRGEGQVIAVIDSELNIKHPMFAPLPEDVNVKLTEEDVRAIASGIGFHMPAGSDCGYHNSKVPYAVNYDELNPTNISSIDGEIYHGSHVAGIAAGDPVMTDEGTLVSGVAPHAQIVFMAQNFFVGSDDSYIAALEDAVKLKADVINISSGTDAELLREASPLTEAINAAEAAGITVCISAGNSDNGSFYFGNNTADNPDRSMMNGFITEGEKSLAVAAADHAAVIRMHTLTHDGTAMPYMGCAESEFADERYLGDALGDAEYVYEYCGLGYPEDYTGKDLTGKLALVDRGGNTFSEKANNAKNAGAVGVIVVQNAAFEQFLMQSDSEILLAMVSQEDGEILKHAEAKTVRFSDETVDYSVPQTVSSYTSWGVHNTLELRPDIMAFGTNIESAGFADDSVKKMSGTSMASPYVAGCAAILNEYLTKTGCTLTGSERQQRIRNLLMTSAVPFRENDMFVTPRRQGSGMISVNRAVHDKVLLTGAEGESKLSLREQLGTEFSFPVTVTNISDENVTFSSARVELTTDAADYDAGQKEYVIGGQQPLRCTADPGGITEIAAGASKTVHVTVTLDAAQAASIHKVFTNGFFIEGYLLLEGAENCCDVSVPLLGFSDSFTDLPLLGTNYATIVNTGYLTNRGGVPSYFELVQKAQMMTWPVYPEEADDPEKTDNMTDEELAALQKKLEEYDAAFIQNELALRQFSDTVYVSPNNDYVTDSAGMMLRVNHDCLVNGCELLDADGNSVAKPFQEVTLYRDTAAFSTGAFYPAEPLTDLAEGTYTLRAELGMTRESLQNRPQTIETKVVIDKKAPDIRSEVTENNGRKILKLTAKDDYLDSIVLLGNGTGKPAGDRQYERLSGSGLDPLHDFLDKGIFHFGYNPLDAEDLHTVDTNHEIEDQLIAPFAYLLGEYHPELTEEFLDQYDFSDIIRAVPDQNGTFTLEYDITDFDMYYIAVLDKAFNMNCIDYADEVHRPTFIQPGIYKSLHGLYTFTESDVTFIPFGSNCKPVRYHYDLKAWRLNECMFHLYQYTDDTDYTEYDSFYIQKTEGTDFYLYGNAAGTSFRKAFGFAKATEEHLELTGLTSAEGYLAISDYALENDYIIPFMKEHTGCFAAKIYQYDYEPDAVVTFSVLCNAAGGGHSVHTKITADLKTGIAALEDGSKVNLLEYVKPNSGDANCDSRVDVADAVLIARILAEDKEAVISSQGMRNADCNRSSQPDPEDIILILNYIAHKLSAL